MQMFTVIGRGHSGTRAMSHTLSQSGVFMGETLNKSGDLIPPQDMYEACRVIGRFRQSREIIGVKGTVIGDEGGQCPHGGTGCGVCASNSVLLAPFSPSTCRQNSTTDSWNP